MDTARLTGDQERLSRLVPEGDRMAANVRPVDEGAASSLRPEEAIPARKLLQLMDTTPPYPESMPC